MTIIPVRNHESLPAEQATVFAEWFATLSDPTRVRLLHTVSTAPGQISVGDVARMLDISQPTASHHVKKLADVGFIRVEKQGTTSLLSVNAACCSGLPHAADVVMGSLEQLPCCPEDLPEDVNVRALKDSDWEAVRQIYAQGIATRNATFETEVPSRRQLEAKWLAGHRWVAEVDGQVAGWASMTATSARECYSGVVETSVYVAESFQGRGVGKSLVHRQVNAADEAGMWTLQTSIFPENRASLNLHHSAGFRTLAVRDRIAQLDGVWRDTVFLERRTGRNEAESVC